MTFTLAEMVQAVLSGRYTTREEVREALRTGRLAPFVESRGKTLEMATTMLWDAVESARRVN